MSRSDNIGSVEPTVLGFSKVQWAGIGLIALSIVAMVIHWVLAALVAGAGVWLYAQPAIREYGARSVVLSTAMGIAVTVALAFVAVYFLDRAGLLEGSYLALIF